MVYLDIPQLMGVSYGVTAHTPKGSYPKWHSTDTAARNAKAKDKLYKLYDEKAYFCKLPQMGVSGGGLSIVI